jgi:hypothetical protein
MSYPRSLPGRIAPQRSFRPGLFFVFLFALVLFLGGGYVLLQAPQTPTQMINNETPQVEPVTDSLAQDLAVHLRNNQSQLVRVIESLERNRALLQRTGPYLRTAGYNLQARWLESADSHSDAALQAARYALQETEAAITHLQERSTR